MVQMHSSRLGVRDKYIKKGRKAKPKQRGERVVNHSFGRLVNAQGIGMALVAIPLLAGESLRSFKVDCFACTDDAQAIQPDSAQIYASVLAYEPGNMARASSPWQSTSAVNNVIDRVMEGNSQGPFEQDPNPGGQDPTLEGRQFEAGELLFADFRMLTPMGQPVLGTSVTFWDSFDSRHVDRFTRTHTRNIYSEQGGVVVFGVWSPTISAQTDFGVADFDLSAEDIADMIREQEGGEIGATQQKVLELLYGGDTYIEADTLKSLSTAPARFQGLCQAVIGTPYPYRLS